MRQEETGKLIRYRVFGVVLKLGSPTKINFMTDLKPVSVQACNRHAQPRKQAPHGSFTTSGTATVQHCCPAPPSMNRIDASTDGSHLLQAPLMTAADQQGSTVIADIMTIFGGNIAEEPEPLGSTDCVIDRVRTDLVEALSSIWQLSSDP